MSLGKALRFEMCSTKPSCYSRQFYMHH